MARVRKNLLIRGLTGSVGDQFVIKTTRSGKTIISNKPEFDEDREFTEPQVAQQSVFTKATIFAKKAQHQPFYQENWPGKATSAYNMAMSDYLKKPEILDIDITEWNGRIGEPIYVMAVDNVKVARVRVIILANSEDNDALDGGPAVESEYNGLSWVFTATKNVELTPGMQIDAYVYDMANNLTKESLVLS